MYKNHCDHYVYHNAVNVTTKTHKRKQKQINSRKSTLE